MKVGFRNLLLAASLANFFLISEWLQLVFPFRDGYFDHPISLVGFEAVILAFACYTGFFYLLFFWAQQVDGESWVYALIYLILVSAFFWALNEVRSRSGLSLGLPYLFSLRYFLGDWGWVGNRIKGLLGVLAFVFVFFRFRHTVIFCFRKVLSILIPAIIATFGQVAMSLDWPTAPGMPLGDPSPETPHKLVFLVFDEMDEYYSFHARPQGVEFPHSTNLKRSLSPLPKPIPHPGLRCFPSPRI